MRLEFLRLLTFSNFRNLVIAWEHLNIVIRPFPRCLPDVALALLLASVCFAQQNTSDPAIETKTQNQQASPASAPAAAQPPVSQPMDKRILGVLPNYRTVQDTGDFEPLTARRKLWIASKDTFDYPTWFTAAAFAGFYQMEDSPSSFGQGTAGYFKRYGASLADQMNGNMLTEGILPVLFHEDPRYFRRGTGPKWHRTGYALTRVLVTRTDAGTKRFNFSEVVGNSIAVAVSNSYYVEDRTVHDNLEKLGLQVGVDALSNVLKEFWPDIKFWYQHRHHPAVSQP